MSTQRHRPKAAVPSPVLLPYAYAEAAASAAPPARPPLHQSPRPTGQRFIGTPQHNAAAAAQTHSFGAAAAAPAPIPVHAAGSTVFSPRPNNVYTPTAKIDAESAARSQNLSFAHASANMPQQPQPFNWRTQLQQHSEPQQQSAEHSYAQQQYKPQQHQQQSYLNHSYPSRGDAFDSSSATSPVASYVPTHAAPSHLTSLNRRPAAHEFDPSQAAAFGGPMPQHAHTHAAPRSTSAPAPHQHHHHAAHPSRGGAILSPSIPSSSSSSDDFGFEDPLHSPPPSGRSKSRRGGWALMDPSLRPAIFNLCNMILGSGVVALPAAVASAGIMPGLAMLCVLAAVSAYSLRLLVASASALHVSDYDELLRLTFGARGRMLSLLSILALDLGAMVTFLIIIADTMPPVMSAAFAPAFASRNGTLCLLAIGAVLPLSCLRSLRSLAWASMASVISVLAIVVIVCGKVMLGDAGAAGALDSAAAAPFVPVSWGLGPSFLSAFGCLSFVFVCHDLSFPVFQSIGAGAASGAANGSSSGGGGGMGGGGGGGSSQKRWARVVDSAVLLSLFPAIALSLAGVFGFGAGVASNVLNSFPASASASASSSGSLALGLCRASLGLSMVATYPLNCYMCRQVLVKMRLGVAGGKQLQTTSALAHGKAGMGGATGPHAGGGGGGAGASALSLGQHLALTLVLFAVSLILACSFSDLGRVQSLVGGLAGCMLAFVLPPAAALRARHISEGRSYMHRDNWPALALLVFAMAVMLATVAQNLFGADEQLQLAAQAIIQ